MPPHYLKLVTNTNQKILATYIKYAQFNSVFNMLQALKNYQKKKEKKRKSIGLIPQELDIS